MKTINCANLFLRCERNVQLNLISYYNINCAQFVKPERKYYIEYGDSWCAMFTSVIAHMCNVDDFPYEVSVNEQMVIAKNNGKFITDHKLVRQGDLIIFDWDGAGFPDHVGFVESIINDVVRTIEGNKNGTVGKRNIPVNSPKILGFIKL